MARRRMWLRTPNDGSLGCEALGCEALGDGTVDCVDGCDELVSTKWGGPGFVGCVGISGVNVFCVAGAASDGEVDCPSGSDEDTPGYTLACTNDS